MSDINLSDIIKNLPRMIFLGIDPLNSLAGSFLKLLGVVDRFVYLNPDYSDRRFENRVLNWFYYACDSISSRYCDYNCCAAELTIKEKLRRYPKITGYEDKLIHLPNYPLGATIRDVKAKKTDHLSIVYVGYIGDQIDFYTLFELVEKLNEKRKTTLDIVGSGRNAETIESFVRDNQLDGFITFHGFVSDKAALYSLIARCHFGIAVYKGSESYDKDRDSAKAREYIALETIPIISSNVISTAQDIQRNVAGIVVDSIHDLWVHIDDLFDGEKAEKWRGNCRKMYQKDKDAHVEFINNVAVGKH